MKKIRMHVMAFLTVILIFVSHDVYAESIREGKEKISENSIGTDEKADVMAPRVMLNGFMEEGVYGDGMTFELCAEDNEKGLNVRYRCIMLTSSGQQVTLEDSNVHADEKCYKRSVSYTEEGVYYITLYAYDDSGNGSEIIDKCFAIDSSAPCVSFSGFDYTKPSVAGSVLEVSVKELFFEGMEVSVRVFRKDGDIITEIPVSNFEYKAVTNKNVYTFAGDGEYTVSVFARDKAGHVTTNEISFCIDSRPPIIDILFDGDYPENGMILNGIPRLSVSVTENNYAGGVISTVMYRKKGDSLYEEVPVSPITMSGVKTICPLEIKEEGSYELKVAARDGLGNLSTENVSFTIDMAPPVIGYIGEFNQKYLKSFNLPSNLKDYMKDMTDVGYKAYLNSVETGAGEIKKDGKYILQVVAFDEAGNSGEEMIAFIVDNTKPIVVLQGLNDDGKMEKGKPVRISLKDERDLLTNVFVNGEKKEIMEKGSFCEIIPEEYGNYRIYISARDNAGNITTETITASCDSVLAAPLSQGIKDITVKTLENKNLEENLIKKPPFELPPPAVLWVMCVTVCAFAVMLVIIAFSVEISYTK